MLGNDAPKTVENTPAGPRFGRIRPAWILAGLALLIALLHLHTFNEPTDCDLASYAVIANEVIAGEQIYEGFLMDQKPPGIHFTYGVAQLLAGYGRGQIYLLGVGAAVATLLGAYFAGKSINEKAALCGALFWTLTCCHLPLEANQPNSEVFINAWSFFGLAWLLKPRAAAWEWRNTFYAGCCFAAASLYKHSMVILPAILSLACLLVPAPGKSRKESFLDLLIVGGVGAGAWILLFAYFGMTGRFKGIYDSLITYNQFYAQRPSENLLLITKLFPPALYGLLPLFVLSLLGIYLLLEAKRFHQGALLIALAVGTGVAIALPGRFFPHYYQLWFPFLILGSIFAMAQLWERTAPVQKVLGKALVPVVLVALLIVEVPFFFLPAREWSRKKYGALFCKTDDLARELKQRLLPEERFFQVGNQAQLYFDIDQRPGGPIAGFVVFVGPLAPSLSAAMMKELKEAPPSLLILEKYALPAILSGHPLKGWIDANYSKAPLCFNRDPLFLFVRKKSALEGRLLREEQGMR